MHVSHSHYVLRRRLLLVALIVLAVCLVIALTIMAKSPPLHTSVPSVANTTAAQPQKKADVGLPTRLKIPRISVDAAVEQVGLTPQGALDVPSGPANAGWYSRGPRPGQTGSAVIDGHFGWTGGTSAIFDNLDELRAGDKLYVEDPQGAITTFVVREIRSYSSDQDAADVFVSGDDKAHLNLISCQGKWSKTLQSYSSRLIVFADLEI